MTTDLLIIFVVVLPLFYIMYITYKNLKESSTFNEYIRQIPTTDSLEPNKTLEEAADKYLSYKSESFLLDTKPEDDAQALELLKTLYVNYVNDISPYRVVPLDFFEFSLQHESLHLFSSSYGSYRLSSFNSQTAPISLKSFLILQTP